MTDELIAFLEEYEGITRHGPLLGASSWWKASNARLPLAHQAVLRWSNGLEVFFGYFRLFGVSSDSAIDMLEWNDPKIWKFSWDDRCSQYWCFGETAWGDQYAYRSEDLQDGRDAVYFLDALSMSPQRLSDNCGEFFEREFVRCAKLPYDEVIVKAYRRFGQLELSSHLIYIPSPLLGGSEDIAHVQKMNARAGMICNGDIATQLDRGPEGGEVQGIHTYTDEHGRLRLRLTWK